MNGKKWTMILVPLGIFLLGQLLMAVWWASSVDTKLTMLSKKQTAISTAINIGMKDRYTGNDADRDLQRQRVRDKEQDDRINKLHTDGHDD